jgi:DNA-binding MarR family transcriptional regulator
MAKWGYGRVSSDTQDYAAQVEALILAALKAPGGTEGVRKIAKRFGVDPGTVQRISRPFDGGSLGAAA